MENNTHDIRNIFIAGRDYVYIHTDKTAKFENDLFAVADIINKGSDNITDIDRMRLLSIYRPSWHDSGKIEGTMSFDSTATNCEFCQAMREAAKNNPFHICGYCYDYAQEHGYKGVNVLNRHSLNMIIMSSVEFTIEELATLSTAGINRINSSGDIPNIIYACNMIKLCFAHPFVRFGFWAKNTAAVIAACDKYGKPSNVKLVQSSPIINKPCKLTKYFDVVFTVYSDKEAITAAIAAGACECNGKKCKACGYKCYKDGQAGGWKDGANIAEYLRLTSKDRVEKFGSAK